MTHTEGIVMWAEAATLGVWAVALVVSLVVCWRNLVAVAKERRPWR